MRGQPFGYVVARLADRMLAPRDAARNAAAAAYELGRRNAAWRQVFPPVGDPTVTVRAQQRADEVAVR